MKFIFSQKKDFTRSLRSLHMFAPPCNILYISAGQTSFFRLQSMFSFKFLTFLQSLCRFKVNARRISQIMRDRKRFPLEEAVDWIEFVLRHRGARHLRAQVVNLSWYQYYLLDVLLFFVVISGAFSLITIACCRCLCKCCSKRSGAKSKKE